MVSAKYTEAYKSMERFKDVQDNSKKPNTDESLNLYAWAKVAEKKDFASAPKPSFYNLTAKAKYNAWQKSVDDGLSPVDAEKKYMALAENLLEKYKP